MKTRYLSSAIAAALLAASGSALAITSVESNSAFPLSFANPGARSLAMGGAFVGAADDATAALTNPAGLTRIGLEQQFSVELRHNSFDTPFAAGGSATIRPLNLSGVNYGNAEEELGEVAFISWVLPRDTWALALYRHQFANFEANYQTDVIRFGSDGFFVNPYRASTDLEIVSYGASFAYNLSDSISLGAGVTWYDFEFDSATERFDPLDRFGRPVANQFADAQFVSVQTQNGDDDDVGFNFGLLYRGSDNFSIGLAYRSAPKFDYRYRNIAGPALLQGALGTSGVFTGQELANQSTPFDAPDVFSIGFSWRPTDQLLINLDVNKINYSNLTEQVDSAFFNDPNHPLTIVTQVDVRNAAGAIIIPRGTAVTGLVAGPATQALQRAIRADNVVEPRLGMEYTFINMAHPFSLRAGVWREELHSLQFVGDPERFSAPVGDAEGPIQEARANAILFSNGDDEMHWSVGMGWAFAKFQVDMAYDMSERQDTLSVSGVLRF